MYDDDYALEPAEALRRLRDPHAAWRREPPTPAQERFLRSNNLWQQGFTRGQASTLISEFIAWERERYG
jgi:hypothetical protein